MVFWSLVFVLFSCVLLLGNFFYFPQTAYQLFPIVTLLGSLGLLYRTLYKMRLAEEEHYRLEIFRLKNELDDYKKNILSGDTELKSKK
jgi:hypothetical protein